MKRSELPSLDDLRAFETTARRGSVRAAADEMALTHAAVSRRVSRLSGAIGTPLFQRAGRGLELTEAGEALRASCRRSFDDLQRTISEIRPLSTENDRATLLSCERSVAMKWLIPRLSQFHDAYPEAVVHLSVGGGAIKDNQNTSVIALRRFDFELGDQWTFKVLVREMVGAVMTKSLKQRYTSGDYIALVSRTRPEAWDNWLASNPDCPRPKERRTLDHHFLATEAACSGLGVALAPFLVAHDDLEKGRLIAPDGFSPDGSDYILIYRKDASESKTESLLVEWLVNQCNDLVA
jgi:DNA-binding transcriptional LysR family regulator